MSTGSSEKWPALWAFRLLFSLVFTGVALSAASFPTWRCWQADTGLTDSNIEFISRDPSGAIWAVHGDLPAISRFDGRNFQSVAAPPRYGRFDSLDGKSGWIADFHGLHHLRGGQWVSFPNVGVFAGFANYFQSRYFVRWTWETTAPCWCFRENWRYFRPSPGKRSR